jgi:hypothetical protein
MTRRCGDCQLCCRLLPTDEIKKPALERCPHQKHGVGCAIYARRPMSCALWSCRWLVDDDTQELPRPDRSHYVIDQIPDFITMRPHDGSAPQHIEVIQVWVDPAHRLAHRAPSFRRWLEHRGKPAIIRYSSREGFVLFPPCCTNGEGWVEHESGVMEGHTHTLEEKAAALGGQLEVELDGASNVYRTTLRVGDDKIEIGTVPIESAERATEALARARRIAEERLAQIAQTPTVHVDTAEEAFAALRQFGKEEKR